jgi:hypothetical protein
MKKLYIIFALTILSLYSFSQNNGPGGVGDIGSGDVMLWLRADDLSSLNDGDNVVQWNDVTSYGNNAVSLSGHEPTLDLSGAYPVVKFAKSNVDFMEMPHDASLDPSAGISMFVVGKWNSISPRYSPFFIKTDNWVTWGNGYGISRADGDINNKTLSFVKSWKLGLELVTVPGQMQIFESTYDLSDITFQINENTGGSKSFSGSLASTNKLFIGATPDGDSGDVPTIRTGNTLDGSIAEIVLINRGVNEAERIIIANYLHGKYNLTLNNNNYWTYNSNYTKDIIGVGVSGTSEHTLSRNDVLSLELSDGTTLSKSGFLLAGNNDKDIIGDANCGKIPEVSTFKSSKEWKMDFSSFKGKLTITVDFTNTNLAPSIGTGLTHNNDIKLLWSDTSGDYTSSNSGYILGVADVANKKWTFVIDNIDLNEIRYYSIGAGRGVEYDGSSLKYIDDGLSANISTADGWENLKVSSGKFEIPANTASVVYYGRVEVSSSAELKINSNSKLMFYCEVTNDGTINVENSASIVPQVGRRQIPCIGGGMTNIKRNSPDYQHDYLYSYWSSPVNNAKIADVFDDVTPNDFYSYDASGGGWVSESATNAIMNPGVGYAITGADGQSGVQERIFNNNQFGYLDVDVKIFQKDITVDGSTYGNFNLIGNPYPSALDLNKVHTDNSANWDGIAYLYNHQHILPGRTNDPNDYITVTATGSTPAGTDYSVGTAQGFMIKASNNNVDFKFNTDQEFKVPGNNATFYKKSPIERVWLVLSNNDFSTSTLLGFTDNATDERDDKYDGVNISGSTDLQFYSLINDVRFAVQATDSDIESKQIKIGMYAGETGKYTISILQDELNGHNVYLEDKLLGVSNWNLSNTDYEFDVDVSDTRINDRFVVSFTEGTLSSSDKFDSSDIKIFVADNLLSISKDKNITKVEMISTSGKIVESWQGNSKNIYNIDTSISRGIYVIRAYSNNGVYVKKVVM